MAAEGRTWLFKLIPTSPPQFLSFPPLAVPQHLPPASRLHLPNMDGRAKAIFPCAGIIPRGLPQEVEGGLMLQ
jgi:hypothetical protein